MVDIGLSAVLGTEEGTVEDARRDGGFIGGGFNMRLVGELSAAGAAGSCGLNDPNVRFGVAFATGVVGSGREGGC